MTTVTPIRIGASRTPGSQPKKSFQTDIEGLRAIAVLGVVAYHASVPYISGGFVGVDVFFVISGYLITGLLLREAQSTGRISFSNFYGRRARRILPSASIVLVTVALASSLVLSPLAAFRALQDTLFATFYSANWHFIALGTDYLAGSTNDSVVLHFWSLAVEEQFYIVWPLLVLAAVLLSRRFPFARTRTILTILGVVAAVSFVDSLALTTSDPTLAYMATTTRAWEFGVGALLAAVTYWLRERASQSQSFQRAGLVIGWMGVLAVLGSMVLVDNKTPFPGTAALYPTLGTAAVIAGGVLWGTSGASVGRILSLAPVRFIGRISFTWYLWHWPVLVLAQARFGTLTWQEKAALSVLAFGLSVVTHYAIELPLMNWSIVKTRVSSAAALGLVSTVVAISATLSLGTFDANAANGSAVAASSASFKSIFGAATGRNSGAVSPSPLLAPKDLPKPGQCQLDHQLVAPKGCDIGNPTGTPVVLFGDSHANQWLPALTVIAKQRDWHLYIMTKSGCPVPNLRPRNDGSRYSDSDCIQWRQKSITTIVHTIKPRIIVVSSLSIYSSNASELLTAWNKSLDQLRELQSPIVYIEDTPFPGTDIPACISGHLDNWNKCSFNLSDAHRIEAIPLAVLRGSEPHVSVVDLTALLCTNQECPAVRNGVLLYRDTSHITTEASKLLAPALEAAMVSAKVLPKK